MITCSYDYELGVADGKSILQELQELSRTEIKTILNRAKKAQDISDAYILGLTQILQSKDNT